MMQGEELAAGFKNPAAVAVDVDLMEAGESG